MNKYFAGGNTPFGFVSYFENIFDYTRGGKLFILKGGSGVGKSTFMKEFANILTERGCEMNYYYCSGDSESLDGIFCQKLNLGMIDGTAPHEVNPIFPIISEEIINLGFYVDCKKLQNPDAIKSLVENKKMLYQKAYKILNSTYGLDEVQRLLVLENLDQPKLIKYAHSFAKDNLPNYPNCEGNLKKAFLSAYTPEGHISFEGQYKNSSTVLCTKCLTNHELAMFLQEVASLAIVQGNEVCAFYNPLRPQEIQYLYLPQNGIAIGDFCAKYENFEVNLQGFIKNFDTNQACLFEQVDIEKERLLVLVYDLLAKAKDLHKKIEEDYIKAVDWDKLEEFKKDFFKRLSQ